MVDESAVRKAEEARRKAMVEADVDTLSKLFAEDMVWIHGTGRVDTKADLLANIGSLKTQYLAIDCSEETQRVINDLVLMSGLAKLRLRVGEEEGEVLNRFTIIWRFIAGGYQVINWQSTPVRDV